MVANESKNTEAILYKCEPIDFLWMPKYIRKMCGWIIVTVFATSFLSIPISCILLIPAVWRNAPVCASIYAALLVLSMMLPMKEWPYARKLCQLTYEIFDFSCNLSDKQRKEVIIAGDTAQYIIGMHPHGIVPLQALLWCAYCDQYMSDDEGRKMYGFGAAADVVMYIPFLRNLMGWLSGGSASYKALHDGLTKGKAPVVNAAGRTPRHLYILPGGIAEIFTSTPGKHTIVAQRKGLMRLSLETGAHLYPCYVFGGTDFYDNLATGDNLFSRLSRKLRMGIALFYGQYGLPVPYAPKVTLVIGEAVMVEKWTGEGPVPQDRIDALHKRYLDAFRDMFEKYKASAGYPDGILEIQ